MPIHSRRTVLAASLGLAAAASLAPAQAEDRPVTPEERRQIEETLRREGFSRWGDIEVDDGRFEVDDAVAADGQAYDLELSRVDFSIEKRSLSRS